MVGEDGADSNSGRAVEIALMAFAHLSTSPQAAQRLAQSDIYAPA